MDYYGTISIKDNDNKRYVFNGKKSSMYQRPQNIFKEAQEYRKIFGALTESRLRWSEVGVEEEMVGFELFTKANPRQLFLNLLMMDFYNGVPTSYGCFEGKVGKNRAAKICNEAIKNKLCTKETDPKDKRCKMLFPTIFLVQKYESKLSKMVFRTAFKSNQLSQSRVVRLLVDFDKLRQKHLPPEISSQVTFDLMEEFMKTSDLKRGSNNPYLKNTPQN